MDLGKSRQANGMYIIILNEKASISFGFIPYLVLLELRECSLPVICHHYVKLEKKTV